MGGRRNGRVSLGTPRRFLMNEKTLREREPRDASGGCPPPFILRAQRAGRTGSRPRLAVAARPSRRAEHLRLRPSAPAQDIYSRQELEASAANKESFFARRMAENESKPEGIPPSQGGKYVGFGSSPAPSANRNAGGAQGDVMQVVSQGFGRLSLVAASAAQSAASVVQVGTKEIQSKMKEGGYDQKVNETVSVVANKTAEIGSRTWGIMRGVMAMASQKVEEYAKEGGVGGWGDDWQRREQNNEPYQRFEHESGNGWSSSQHGSSKNYNSNSWDDWDDQGKKDSPAKAHQSSDSWAGWDDGKDDSFDSYDHSTPSKGSNQNGTTSGSYWTDGGFR
ncbi:hypothetical protein ACP70R_017413 [Stipagrostis hirtigluma subsp. patula]